ncbi:unnamed protein product [Soboliphyme baturini]|uniref:Cilia- and flagella-associated protein 157 n=1 Tax=Soboliphyme baturini TaxID=241478 RepID=A0A183IEX7_9BILA|nr:unnamed protein product [Soboliphyme baturini]
MKLKEENCKLVKAGEQFQTYLQAVKAQVDFLVKEKLAIEKELDKNFHHTALMEDERRYYCQRIKKLLNSLDAISQERKMVEEELQGESVARQKAERALKATRQALERIEGGVKLNEGAGRSEIMRDLRQDIAMLRAFIEEQTGVPQMPQKWNYKNLDMTSRSLIKKYRQRGAISCIDEEE